MFKLVLLLALLYSIFLKNHTQESFYSFTDKIQKEVKEAKPLLKNGILQDAGYSREMHLAFSPEEVYPAFFGLHWLKSQFKYKQFDKFMVLVNHTLYQFSVQHFRYVVYFDFVKFDFNNKILSLHNASQWNFSEDNVRIGGESPFGCKRAYSFDSQKSFKVHSFQDAEKCNIQLNFEGELFTISHPLHDTLYEVNPLDEEQSLFTYSMKTANNSCTTKTNYCSAAFEMKKNNQPFNFSGASLQVMGKTKEGEEITVFFEEGIQHSAKSKSLPHGFKVSHTFHRLHPLVASFETLNLNNGGSFSTHESWRDVEGGKADLVFTGFSNFDISHNWVLVQKNIKRGLVSVSGWVSDASGKKYEFESLYGVLDVFQYRG